MNYHDEEIDVLGEDIQEEWDLGRQRLELVKFRDSGIQVMSK